jgi:hypothetical protein
MRDERQRLTLSSFGPLFDALAVELAPRLAAALNGRSDETEPAPEPWRLIPLEEAARRLTRSTRWVRQRKEQIGYVKLDGGALAFDPSDLEAFARARRVGGG